MEHIHNNLMKLGGSLGNDPQNLDPPTFIKLWRESSVTHICLSENVHVVLRGSEENTKRFCTRIVHCIVFQKSKSVIHTQLTSLEERSNSFRGEFRSKFVYWYCAWKHSFHGVCIKGVDLNYEASRPPQNFKASVRIFTVSWSPPL
jgi:hypothetical protein